MNAAMPLKKIPVIKLVLLIRNRSVQELATHVGVARPYVSTWVNGHDEPSRAQAQKIAEYLKWDLDEIWEDAPTVVKKKRASKQKVGKAKLVDESALKMGDPAPAPALYALPDYTAIEAAGLKVIRSITYEGSDAVERVVSPWAMAASDPAELDPDDRGVVSIPARESTGRQNAPLWPVEVSGESMNRIIPNGALVFVRRSSRPPQNRIVLATVHGGVTMKWLRGTKLEPDSTDQRSAIDLLEESELIGEVVAVHIPAPK